MKLSFSLIARKEARQLGLSAAGEIVRKQAATKAVKELNSYAKAVQQVEMNYPPQVPPAPVVRKSGKVYYPKPYRRTLMLGRNWTVRGPRSQGSAIVVEVGNIMQYWAYVQGKRQRIFHKAHGWLRVQDVGKEIWSREYKNRIRDVLRGK